MAIQNHSLLHKLQKAGFSDKEALIYVALLELGGAFPSRIAEYTELNRSTVYKILLTLSIRGLVNEIEKKNKLFYQIEKPERFIKYTESQIRRAEDSLEVAKKLLPEITELHDQLGEKPKITYYEGLDGVEAIYMDHFSSGKPFEMLAWADVIKLQDFLPRKFFEDYVKRKEEIGIVTRGIVPDTEKAHYFNEDMYANIDKKLWPQIRFAPSESSPMVGEIVIYAKNKVSIINFSKTNTIGTIIEDENIHKMMTTIFNLSWESALLSRIDGKTNNQ